MSYPDGLRLQVEGYLEELDFPSSPAAAGLVEAMRYSLLAGGKRVRPVLALATARSLGAEPAELLGRTAQPGHQLVQPGGVGISHRRADSAATRRPRRPALR